MKVELVYPIYGKALPSKHNYQIYSALCNWNAYLKEIDWQHKAINGFPDHRGHIRLGKKSNLKIRCNYEDLELWCNLNKAELRVGSSHHIMVGEPEINMFDGSPSLRSKIVTIKRQGKNRKIPKQQFRDSLMYQLFKLGIQCEVTLKKYSEFYMKRVPIGGYAVHLSELKKEESILIQSEGLGGKKRMGCGYFEP